MTTDSRASSLRLVTAPRRVAARLGPSVVVALATLLSVACGDGRKGANDGRAGDAAAGAPGAAGASPTAAAATKPACLLEGDWTPCAVEDRLEHAGLVVVKQDEPPAHAFFTVPGVVYQVGGKDDLLEIYVYPSTEARRRDTDALDSVTVSPKGKRESWSAPPTLVTSNNLAAVIVSLNDRTIERLSLALGAGLPQPENK